MVQDDGELSELWVSFFFIITVLSLNKLKGALKNDLFSQSHRCSMEFYSQNIEYMLAVKIHATP